jgi:hypothetical protein
MRGALKVLRLAWPPTQGALLVAYHRGLKRARPDRGGTVDDFCAVVDAWAVVQQAIYDGLPTGPARLPEPVPDADEWCAEAKAVAALEDFAAGFRPSRKGNLWRRWGDVTLTVFRRRCGYGWAIAEAGGLVTYSGGTWPTEEEALAGLWEALCSCP